MDTPGLFDFVHRSAVALFEIAGSAQTVFHCLCKDRIELTIHPNWEDAADKNRIAVKLRRMFQVYEVERYAFVTESWAVEERDPKRVEALMAYADAHNGRLVDHPDRYECIQIMAEDTTGSSLHGEMRILRPEHGRPKLMRLRMIEGVKTDGLFTGMLRRAA